MTGYRIGVDVGGTYVKIALVDANGEIKCSNKVSTRAEMGYEYTVGNIKQAIYDLIQESGITKNDIEGIGFGFPGQIDYQNGIVRELPNIPGWTNVPIAKIMEQEFGIKTKVDNDVRCAALGELKYGAGQNSKNLICVTIGTGIGSAIIIDGKLVRGASNAAGEIGHIKMSIHDGPICGCGDTGCFEAYASGPAIVAMAKDYIKGGKSAKFRELANGKEIEPYFVAQAAQQGDSVAKRIFEIMGEYIGVGLSSVVNLLNPERIVIGGGVADAGEILFDPIRRTINNRAMKISADALEIIPAKLGNNAGVIGACLLIDD